MQMLMKHRGGRLKIKSGRVSESLSITCKKDGELSARGK